MRRILARKKVDLISFHLSPYLLYMSGGLRTFLNSVIHSSGQRPSLLSSSLSFSSHSVRQHTVVLQPPALFSGSGKLSAESYLSAPAPDTTSIISRVIAACRTLFMYSVS